MASPANGNPRPDPDKRFGTHGFYDCQIEFDLAYLSLDFSGSALLTKKSGGKDFGFELYHDCQPPSLPQRET